jgi:hypothetical protein
MTPEKFKKGGGGRTLWIGLVPEDFVSYMERNKKASASAWS